MHSGSLRYRNQCIFRTMAQLKVNFLQFPQRESSERQTYFHGKNRFRVIFAFSPSFDSAFPPLIIKWPDGVLINQILIPPVIVKLDSKKMMGPFIFRKDSWGINKGTFETTTSTHTGRINGLRESVRWWFAWIKMIFDPELWINGPAPNRNDRSLFFKVISSPLFHHFNHISTHRSGCSTVQ